MKKSVIGIILFSILAVVAFGDYQPASVPMGNYTVQQGVTFSDTFYIIDPNGPAGLTIGCEPPGLIINEPVISSIEGDSEAKLYAYPYTFTPTHTGTFTFTIISADTMGTTVEQQIVFNVEGNAPQVFMGCAGMGYVPPQTVSSNFEEQVKWKYAMLERVASGWMERDIAASN